MQPGATSGAGAGGHLDQTGFRFEVQPDQFLAGNPAAAPDTGANRVCHTHSKPQVRHSLLPTGRQRA